MHFPFSKAAPVLNRLTESGYEAYVVGGAVRDYLLGREVHDLDIATSALPSEVEKLFPHTIPVGIEHGTVLVLSGRESFEVTTFRSESDYQDYRHPSTVTFEKSLEKDLMRRDFTINAMAMDQSGEVIDLFGGRDDMNQRRIRMVGEPAERISEDPLRMMRGIRFTSQLMFSLGEAEALSIKEYAPLLKKISIERIDQEMTRLLAGQAPSAALQLLADTGCLDYLPLLGEKGDLREHQADYTILQSDEERWAVLLSAMGVSEIHEFARRWNWSRSREKSVLQLTEYAGIRRRENWNAVTVYSAGPELAQAIERMRTACGLDAINSLAKRYSVIQSLWAQCPIHSRSELAIRGGDLLKWSTEKPGPWLADALTAIEQQVILGTVPNNAEAIKSWFKAWRKPRKPF